MPTSARRDFLKTSLGLGAAALASGPLAAFARAADKRGGRMSFGMVTYLWGKDWDQKTLIANCAAAGLRGVELRTGHAHKVEPSLSPAERAEAQKRFADSPVKLVSIGSAEEFHHADKARLEKAIEATKAYILLGHDVGASGVKVRPNSLPKEVPQEKTIEQIGKALNVVAAFGAGYGQEIRLEVHGACSPLPIMKQIMDVADHPNVGVCWNSNATDLAGDGLEANFKLVERRFGATTHVRQLDSRDYPFAKLIGLFAAMDYAGWILLEAHGEVPKPPIPALARQRELFEKYLAEAQEKLT